MNRGAIGALAGCLALPPQVEAATAKVVFFSNFEGECSPDDVDLDRLSGCAESGLKLDAANADTDGDGLRDGDEALGTLSGLDLPALGVDPRRKNILIEYDWFEDALETGGPNHCAAGLHAHEPSQTSLDIVATAFAASPVANPDGSQGIDVIQDVGQGGVLSGGGLVPDADGVINGSASGVEFFQFYSNHFLLNRRGYFHYVLLPHRYVTNEGNDSSGSAQVVDGIRRDRIIVSLYCQFTGERVGNTIVHELGHNLGLRHGGDEDCNQKPNYNSVMNYRYQFGGVDTDCDAQPDHVADYSHGTRVAIDENAVDESRGVCGDKAIDFTGSGGIQTGVAANINGYPKELQQCGQELRVLADHDDWGNLEIGVDATMNPDDPGKPVDDAVVCGAVP